MANERFSSDILRITGTQGIPNWVQGNNAGTKGFWGYDYRNVLMAIDYELTLTFSGDPNGYLPSPYLGRKVWDIENNKLWICTTVGDSGVAVFTDLFEFFNSRQVILNRDIGDQSAAISTGTNKAKFRLPCPFIFQEVRINVETAPLGAAIIVDIKVNGVSIFTTKVSIDASETTSKTSSVPYVLASPTTVYPDDAEVTVDFTQVGVSPTGAGLKVILIGKTTEVAGSIGGGIGQASFDDSAAGGLAAALVL